MTSIEVHAFTKTETSLPGYAFIDTYPDSSGKGSMRVAALASLLRVRYRIKWNNVRRPQGQAGASGALRCILFSGKGGTMAKNAVYVERREQGDYAVRKPGSERASAILPTQAKAIERAREMNPDAAVHVERVRDTNVGGRDKWRKL
jgi:hypothetical protein